MPKEFQEEHDFTEMNRRQLLKLTLGAGTGAWLAPTVRAMAMGRKPAQPLPSPKQGESPVQERNPFDHPTFRAFVDTVVPGSHSDPTGAPGALEAGTLEFIHEMDKAKLFPVSLRLVDKAVTFALNTAAAVTHCRTFAELDLSRRTSVLRSLAGLPAVPLLLRLVRAPFYTGAVNRVGFDYLDYPAGPNQGYPDFSFNETDVSPPHPWSVGGNLP